MVARPSIVVNGDLGSGKTTITTRLAERLGIRRISVGDLYREIARRRGMTALQLNRHAELDDEVDGHVDRLQRGIAESGEQLVVDSRLAWFYFTGALKVHLITEPAVAAERVLARPRSQEESYSSVAEATERLRERSQSERTRFLVRYGADKCRLRNYDLVCDTSRASPDLIVEQIVAVFRGRLGADPALPSRGPGPRAPAAPLLLVDPTRVYPTHLVPPRSQDPAPAPGSVAGAEAPIPPRLAYAGMSFFLVDGERELSAAIRSGSPLVPAALVAEEDEPVVGGRSARAYGAAQVSPSLIRDWNAVHGLDLAVPPHLEPESTGATP